MADLSQEQMLEMARVAGLRIVDEDVEHLTFRLNALLEASQVLDQYPLDELKALPSLAHPFELPSHQREHRPTPPLTVETDAPLAYKPPPLGGSICCRVCCRPLCTNGRFSCGICYATRYLMPASAMTYYCRHIRPLHRRGFKIPRGP